MRVYAAPGVARQRMGHGGMQYVRVKAWCDDITPCIPPCSVLFRVARMSNRPTNCTPCGLTKAQPCRSACTQTAGTFLCFAWHAGWEKARKAPFVLMARQILFALARPAHGLNAMFTFGQALHAVTLQKSNAPQHSSQVAYNGLLRHALAVAWGWSGS